MSSVHELGWEIGGLRIAASVPARETPSAWPSLFRTYACRPTADRPADIALELTPLPGWSNTRPVEPGASVWTSQSTPDGTRLEGPYFTGLLRREAGGYSGSFTVEGDSWEGIADLLRSALAHVLAERGQLFLHSSGVLRKGRLWLFSGAARSGKTTIATELNDGGEPFALDRTVLSLSGDAVLAHPTPNSDHAEVAPRRRPRRPTAVVFIEQGPRTTVSPLAPARAAQLLLQHTMVQAGMVHAMPALVETAARIAQRTPALALRFARDEGFWRLLDDRTEAMDPGAREGASQCSSPITS